jgi:oligopeptide/dipeptide ABC transporter ATP-binding protein
VKEAQPLLSVRNLTITFPSGKARFFAVNDASFDIRPRELVGVVGESGSGKSVTALAVMGLLPPMAAPSGEIVFEGRNLLNASRRQLRALRGNRLGMIFQEPMTSLNPVFTVGDQIVEAVRTHKRISPRAARQHALDLLDKVRIPSAARRLDDYPHQLSGGMRQRIMIAIALSCSPRLLIADEPTTALDVTIQAQLLDLLNDIREEFGTAIILITHNMGVIAEVADRVVVMYGGRVIEEANVFDLFDRPQHPYTEGLMASTPDITASAARLTTIPGSMPSAETIQPGCIFAPRCRRSIEACAQEQPALFELSGGQKAACIRAPKLRRELQQ